jgi:hypothetical protein
LWRWVTGRRGNVLSIGVKRRLGLGQPLPRPVLLSAIDLKFRASRCQTRSRIRCWGRSLGRMSDYVSPKRSASPTTDMNWRMNLLLTIVFGVVGLVLSYGFFIPPELSMFRLIAAIGMMVGYRVGQLVGRLVRPSPKRFLILSVGAVLCFYFAFAYASMIQMGSANTSDIVNLGALLGLCFLSLGFLLPFTRVLVPNEIEILWSKAVEYFARLFRG